MRKVLLTTLDFPPIPGGISNYYYNLAKRMPADKIVVLTPTKSAKADLAFPVINKIFITKLPIWPKWLSGLLNTIITTKRQGIELIWVGQILPLGTISLIIKKFFNIPYFISCHGTDILTAKKNNKTKLIKKILARAEFITANSHYTKNELLKLGVRENKIIVVFPCPDDLPDLNEEKKAKLIEQYGLKNKKIILSVGRLVPRKGFAEVIQSLPPLISEYPDLVYLIIGQGPQAEELNNLIKELNLQNYVKILSEVNNEEKNYFYNLANIFIMVPKILGGEVEGFGIVYLEAALFEKPVIASLSGGVAEAVRFNQTALAADPANLTTIREAIAKILTDSKLAATLGENGKILVRTNFQWTVQLNKIIEKL